MFLKFIVAKLLKATYGKYTANSNIQRNIKVQMTKFYISVSYSFKGIIERIMQQKTACKNSN